MNTKAEVFRFIRRQSDERPRAVYQKLKKEFPKVKTSQLAMWVGEFAGINGRET